MARTYRIEWSPTAIEDLDAIIAYVAVADTFEAAAHVHRKVVGRVATLDRVPFRCRIVPELKRLGVLEYRELLVGPYRVCVRVTGEVVGVVAVLDGRRNLEELLLNRFVSGQ